MVKQWHSVLVPTSRAPTRRAHKQSMLEFSAEELLAACSCSASMTLVGDKAELSACALGFSRRVLLTAKEGKSLTRCEPSS